MKKILALVLLLLLIVGCSKQEEVKNPSTPQEDSKEVAEEGSIEQGTKDAKEEAQVNKDLEIGADVGKLAPDFELTSLSGEKVKLSDLRGKPVHLVFWSVDCVYCMQELPYVEKMYQEHKDDYVVLALNVTLQDGMEKFKTTVEEKGYTFLNLPLEEDKGGLEVLQNYRVRGIPHNVFIDKEGVIQKIAAGMMDKGAQETVIKELIAK